MFVVRIRIVRIRLNKLTYTLITSKRLSLLVNAMNANDFLLKL